MDTIARELLSIAKSLVAASTLFKDVPIGGLFHTGISKGIGFDRNITHVTFFEKVDKSSAEVVKSDWAPRQVGTINRVTAFQSVFVVDELPTHDTREGL